MHKNFNLYGTNCKLDEALQIVETIFNYNKILRGC